jgi:hypothetical protein
VHLHPHSSACVRLQVLPQSHRSSIPGPATPAITRSSVRAVHARNYGTSSQDYAVVPHSTKQRGLCTRRAYCVRVSSDLPSLPSLESLICLLLLQLLSLGTGAGVLHPLGNSDKDSVTTPTLSDRFQLGGPTNLRMFRANSLGPRDGGASHSSLEFLSFLPAYTMT